MSRPAGGKRAGSVCGRALGGWGVRSGPGSSRCSYEFALACARARSRACAFASECAFACARNVTRRHRPPEEPPIALADARADPEAVVVKRVHASAGAAVAAAVGAATAANQACCGPVATASSPPPPPPATATQSDGLPHLRRLRADPSLGAETASAAKVPAASWFRWHSKNRMQKRAVPAPASRRAQCPARPAGAVASCPRPVASVLPWMAWAHTGRSPCSAWSG